MKRLIIATAVAGVATFAAAQTAPNDIAFGDYGQIEVSLSGQAGDPAAGLEIMVARGKGNFVGERWTEADLRGIVANAKMTFPESVMPAFYKTEGFTRPGDAYTGKAAEGELSPILTAQEIEDVVAYLMTLTE